MLIDDTIILQVLLHATGFFVLYYMCYRKYIYSILDPLFIYVFTLSFSSVLVVNSLYERPNYILHFFLCNVFLLAGFLLMMNILRAYDRRELPITVTTSFFDYKVIQITIYILFTIYIFANIVLFFTTGFALLSDDPTLNKVEGFSKGFGIILKINWGIGSFLTAGLIFLILSKSKSIDFLLLLINVILTSLEGSKSALLRILITFTLLVNHQLFSRRRDIVNKVKIFLPLGLCALFAIFLIVLFKENVDIEEVKYAFLKRLLYGADSTLYFYTPVNEQYFAKFHFWEYPSHLFNQILSFLRLVTPQEALGNVMVGNLLPNNTGTIVGPNTPYYIEGQVYFGYYGAFVYSMVIGSCYAFIRQYFFKARYYSAFWFVLMCTLCQQATALNIEVTLFLTQLFDTCFFVIPVYIFVSLAIKGKLKFYKLHF